MDPPEPDSSAAWVVAESAVVPPRPRTRLRRWALLLLAIASLLGALVLSVVAFERVPLGQSADMPLPDNRRLGFRGMRGAEQWKCNDAHDHFSLPYWSGILALGALSVVCWARAGRK
ncbi:MAG: hypothetical protein HOV80_35925 [Polyangiaceae bacterium]|nr:hypothetical protein [Polyangiaceae bacterium]